VIWCRTRRQRLLLTIQLATYLFNVTRENKRKVVLVLNYAPCYDDVWGNGGMEVQLHTFLTSAIDGSELSASCPGGKCYRIHWTEGQVGPITNVQNNILLLSGIELRFVGRPDRTLVAMLSYSSCH
jgi:hypothetical protein